jgi:hypothetical protein
VNKMNTYSTKALVVALGVASAAPSVSYAHEQLSHTDRIVSYTGTFEYVIVNKYKKATHFDVLVLNREFEPVAEDRWRSDWPNDFRILAPAERMPVKVQLRDKGKFYICTKGNNNNPTNKEDKDNADETTGSSSLNSVICSRAWYR